MGDLDMNALLFLLGVHQALPPVVEPDPGEPYHVVFNYQVAASDKPNYVFPSELPEHVDKIKSLEPDSDYPPQPEYPYIHFLDGAVLPGFGGATPFQTAKQGAKMVVPKINKIAHPDRRGKLPKAFQMRFGHTGTGFFPSFYVFKYNLNAAGTNFLGLLSYTDPDFDTVSLFLEYNLEGHTSEFSFVHDLGVSLRGSESTDIRFVIWDAKIQVYVNSPGALVAELDLPAPVVIREDVDLAIFEPIDGLEPDVETLIFSDLLIYDAYL